MAAVARPLGKGRPLPAARTDRTLPQLQEAFARGALKPGLNVVLEERPKRRNDTVSGECGARKTLARGPSAGCGAQEAPRGRAGSDALHCWGRFGCISMAPRSSPRCDSDTEPGQPCGSVRAVLC